MLEQAVAVDERGRHSPWSRVLLGETRPRSPHSWSRSGGRLSQSRRRLAPGVVGDAAAAPRIRHRDDEVANAFSDRRPVIVPGNRAEDRTAENCRPAASHPPAAGSTFPWGGCGDSTNPHKSRRPGVRGQSMNCSRRAWVTERRGSTAGMVPGTVDGVHRVRVGRGGGPANAGVGVGGRISRRWCCAIKACRPGTRCTRPRQTLSVEAFPGQISPGSGETACSREVSPEPWGWCGVRGWAPWHAGGA